jgi:hypothetical protein
MLRLDMRVVAAHGNALGIRQGLLEFGGQFVEAHDFPFQYRFILSEAAS